MFLAKSNPSVSSSSQVRAISHDTLKLEPTFEILNSMFGAQWKARQTYRNVLCKKLSICAIRSCTRAFC